MSFTTIIISIIAMLAMASGIIFFVVMYQRRVIKHQQELKKIEEQKELELVQASVRGEETERNRIASELHDDVGATLASVKLFLHSQNKEFGDRPVFVQSRDLIDETITKVRNLSHRLQPAMLKQLGLSAALKSFFDPFNKSGSLRIEYTSETLPRVDDNIELAMYRIVQELTNNIIKHAGATQLTFKCTVQSDSLLASISHNGSGLSDDTFNEHVYKKNAIGLKNIVTRLKSVNGSISFDNNKNMAITNITIPL